MIYIDLLVNTMVSYGFFMISHRISMGFLWIFLWFFPISIILRVARGDSYLHRVGRAGRFGTKVPGEAERKSLVIGHW